MALREELERTGNWFFRWRSYLPLLFFVLVLASLNQFRAAGENDAWDRVWEIFCLGLSLSGLFLRMVTVGSAPKDTSGRNTGGQLAESLNTTGMYSIMRHPLYFGNFLIFLGFALMLRNFLFALSSVLIFWIYYERIMYAEEEFLRKKFGKQYLDWAAKVPVFLPDVRKWTPPAQRVNLRAGFGGEFHGLLLISVVFNVLEGIEGFLVEKRFVIDWMWVAVLAAGITGYLTGLVLKKKTRLLKKD